MRLILRPVGLLHAANDCHWIYVVTIGFLWGFSGWTSNCSAQLPADGDVHGQFQSRLIDIIARCEGAVVAIALVPESPAVGPIVDPFQPNAADTPLGPEYVPYEFGSGVIIARADDPDSRYVLTNYHVVHGSRQTEPEVAPARLMVRLSSRHAVWANEIAGDPRSDLSVLALDLQGAGIDESDVSAFELQEVRPAQKGQLVVALGNPYAIARDGSASASIGIISNIARRSADSPQNASARRAAMIHEFGTLLTVDARLQFGNSGGALLDLDGNLIGLTTSLAALEGYETSAGYAIPLDGRFRRIVDSLLAGYEVEYGFLGIALRDVLQDETREWTSVSQPTAAGADQVAVDSPAHDGGLRPGDIILEVNGEVIYGTDDVTREVGLLGPESIADLTVYRPSESRQLNIAVRLGKWPVPDDSGIVATAQRWPGWRGIRVDYSTARSRFMPFDVLLSYRKAVLIQEVAAGSPAELAGLKVGDMIATVNGAPVETPAEFHRLVSDANDAVELELLDGRRVVVTAAQSIDR